MVSEQSAIWDIEPYVGESFSTKVNNQDVRQ